MISESNAGKDIAIYLMEYSALRPCGLTELVHSTERQIKVSDDLFIPVLFPADRLSTQIAKDKMRNLPWSGCYIEVSYENYKERVVKTAILF